MEGLVHWAASTLSEIPVGAKEAENHMHYFAGKPEGSFSQLGALQSWMQRWRTPWKARRHSGTTKTPNLSICTTGFTRSTERKGKGES